MMSLKRDERMEEAIDASSVKMDSVAEEQFQVCKNAAGKIEVPTFDGGECLVDAKEMKDLIYSNRIHFDA